jgi:lipopolysaccharide transport system ATP-binding protein
VSEIVVSAQGLGKRYLISHQGADQSRLTEVLSGAVRAPVDRLRGRRRETTEWVWALRDVSFELHQGEVVGVIGRNGAGKSTLLKLLSRITEPTVGSATIRGRVASLLEVGTGFHPELTGRENVYLSGAVLGMPRTEIARKFDEIVDFSGVEQFLDTPVKRYSSGMQVRLGFAVAAHLDPEILFIDEVLAVGDIAFQQRCLGKMSDVAGDGRTIVFVSHNMGAIGTLCPTSLWLENGTARMIGPTAEVVPEYVRSSGRDLGSGDVAIELDETREAQVTRVRVRSASGELMTIGECSEPVTVEMVMDVRRRLPGLYAWLEVRRPDGQLVMMSDSKDTTPNPLDDMPVGVNVVTATIPARTLAPGSYDVLLNFTSPSGREWNVHSPGVVCSFRLEDNKSVRGNARPGYFSTLIDWRATRAVGEG